MFTRILDCTIKPDQKEEFRKALTAQVLPALQPQPGFVDLMALASDDRADHATVITFWKSKGDADHFYPRQSPETDILMPFLTSAPKVESFYVTTSALHHVALAKAA
jgi:quinol monooxygenase YgiN